MKQHVYRCQQWYILHAWGIHILVRFTKKMPPRVFMTQTPTSYYKFSKSSSFVSIPNIREK